MKFDYTSCAIDYRGRVIKRPMVELEIFGPKGSHKELALLDSGADYTLLNIEIAKLLHIDLSKARKQEISGVTGKQDVFFTSVDIKAEYCNTINIPVGFIDSPHVGALLGQEGFFDRHKIKFEKDHNAFEVIPAKR